MAMSTATLTTSLDAALGVVAVGRIMWRSGLSTTM